MQGSEGSRSTVGQILPRMGGMALKNGLILVSERYWAAAIRDRSGVVQVASGEKPRVPTGAQAGTLKGVPVLRGLGRLGETMLVVARAKMNLPGAELPIDVTRVVAALAASAGASAALKKWGPKSPLVQEVGAVLASVVPAVLSVKDSEIAGYHGAEHKVIGAREALTAGVGGLVSAVGNSSAASKEHDRCGSNLIGPLAVTTVATNLLMRSHSRKPSALASALAGAAGIGAAIESLRWSAAHPDSHLSKAMMFPGRVVQKLVTTKEPTAEQLEVGERAIAELLRLEGVTE